MSALLPGFEEVVSLRIHAPIACFRRPFAREYMETFEVAPPSTVFGMLLSMVGETDRTRHKGARLIVGRLVESPVSRVLRTTYRWKDKNDPTSAKNRSPDWQELLSDVRVVAWLSDGDEEPAAAKGLTLRQRVTAALADPSSVDRFGGLSLGESTHLVDGVWLLDDRPVDPNSESLEVLIPTANGAFNLPLWPDHVGAKGTRWGRFALAPQEVGWSPGVDDWSVIAPP